MIVFISAVAISTALCAAALIVINKKAVPFRRGGLFIILSCLYFSSIFLAAHLLSESFK